MAGRRRHTRQQLNALPIVTGVLVERLSHEGRGVARVDGKTVFIDGALPGETVSFRYTSRHGQFDEATATEIANDHADRVVPGCAHAARCGGCSLLHFAPDAQVTHKQAMLLELLLHQAKLVPERVLPPVTAPRWGYRRRARLSARVVAKRAELLLGFREKSAHFVADITRCETLIPAVGQHLVAIRTMLNTLSCAAHIPQVEVAAGDTEVALLIRHMTPLSAEDLVRLRAFAHTSGLRIYSQPGNISTLLRLDGPEEPLTYTVAGLTLNFLPGDFVQVNGPINAQIVPLALELLALTAQDTVLDLFSGLGNFTLPIATHAGQVMGIEGDAGLVARARDNATRLGLGNARFEVADLFTEAGIKGIPSAPWTRLLLDPPRSGAAEVLAALDLRKVERVCYVSCNPVTLARDAATLANVHGYTLTATGVIDMFPQTTHVESIALFERR